MKTLSIVVPVYFNEENLPETAPRLLALKRDLPDYRLELVFVDDGSGDDSLRVLLQLRDQFPDEIKVISLTRNFGSMAAIQAGLKETTGHCVGIIAADLQDPPELFIDMVRLWESGVRAVYAVRSEREDSWLTTRLANAYYWLIRKFAIPGYPRGGFDFLLIDRQVVNDLNTIEEKNTNVMSLIYWLGYRCEFLPYVRREREIGESRWTFSKKVKLFIDSFVAFSYAPVRILSLIGLVFSAAAFLYGLFVFVAWVSGRINVEGWTAIIILLALTAGLQMMMLGVLGEYLWRILDEARRRPNYLVERRFDNTIDEDKELSADVVAGTEHKGEPLEYVSEKHHL